MKFKKEDIARFIEKNINTPQTVKSLSRIMNIDKRKKQQFKNIIKQLNRDGRLSRVRGNRYIASKHTSTVIGVYEPVRDGSYGFVIPEDSTVGEIFVKPKRHSPTLLPGDKVEARIDGVKPGVGPYGHVVKVHESSSDILIAKLEFRDTYYAAVPFDKRVSTEIYIIDDKEFTPSDGDFAVVEISSRASRSGMMTGRIKEILGDPETPGVDASIVEQQFNLRTGFDDEVIKSAESSIDVDENPFKDKSRIDYTKQETFTIDGITARDFDDAVFLEKKNNDYILYVHIADVSHFVKYGTALDREAYLRGCSVYFPERAIPMLPEMISNEACSLKPGVNRLAVTCKMTFNAAGELRDAEFAKSVIKSKARLTYDEVFSHLSGEKTGIKKSIARKIDDMFNFSRILRNNRLKNGSIDFSFPETKLIMNDDGEVEGITRRESNIAHEIIEEFMIAANVATATFLLQNDHPSIFRVHEFPNEVKLQRFLNVYYSLGYRDEHYDGDITSSILAQMIDNVKDTVHEYALSVVLLRSMKLAVYADENKGHFALGIDNYTHFTSPIRRYPDLVVHRSVKNLLTSGIQKLSDSPNRDKLKLPRGFENISNVAGHCSRMERNAEDAERELLAWRQLRYMRQFIGDSFDTIIMDITPNAIQIEIEEHSLTAMIPYTELYDDYYFYDENTRMLTGEKTHRKFKIGDKIEVVLTGVDLLMRRANFSILGLETRKKSRAPSGASKKRKY